MTESRLHFDVVVVGAGLAGSCAARALSKWGLSVALVEAGPLAKAGAQWINGISKTAFEGLGISGIAKDALFHEKGRYIIQAGAQRTILKDTPILQIDMKALIRRLHREAESLGTTFLDRSRPIEVCFAGTRPVSLVLESRQPGKKPGTMHVSASLFVDAAGINGSLKNKVPAMARYCRGPGHLHQCTAHQENRMVADRAGLESFMDEHDLEPGDTIAFTGIEGGYSTLTVTVPHENGPELGLLAGTVNDTRFKSGAQLVGEFCAENPWIGETLRSGGGIIPIRRPHDVLAVPGLALLGDSGCQVFPAHGSGTASIVRAAELLANAVGPRKDPGALESVWTYQASFQREIGAVHAAYDMTRRWIQDSPPHLVEQMMAAGLLNSNHVLAGLEQKMPDMSLLDFASSVSIRLESLTLAASTAKIGAKAAAAHAVYKAYPAAPDHESLEKWSKAVAFLFGDEPDVV